MSFQIDIKGIAERTIGVILKAELTEWLGRDKYERSNEEAPNYRNGQTKKKYTIKNMGELSINVPRDRKGDFSSKIVKKYSRKIPMLVVIGVTSKNIFGYPERVRRHGGKY